MTAKQVYDVQLAGLSFKLKAAHQEEFVQELVEFVGDRIQNTLDSSSISLQSAAILTAINLGEELLLLKKEMLAHLDQLEKKAQNISSSLETSRLAQMGLKS